MPCSPGMRRCGRACLHRAMVEDYRAARERDERTRDEQTLGYAADEADYAQRHEMTTFKGWLESLAGKGTYSPHPPDPGVG